MALLTFAGGCTMANSASSETKSDIPSGRPAMGSQAFVIPPNEIPSLQRDALRGSGEAAYKLAQFYDFVVLDTQEGLRWKIIAAENGHANGMYALGLTLKNRPDEQSKERARYWFEKVSKEASGETSDLAKRRLTEMGK